MSRLNVGTAGVFVASAAETNPDKDMIAKAAIESRMSFTFSLV
jgi:hypothetical protein